jgi:hypothetical protein
VPEYPLLILTAWFTAAVWLITWPDRPAPKARDRHSDRVRTWLRISSLAPLASAALACVSEVVAAPDHPLYAGAAMQLALVLPVVTFLLFEYLAHLSRRLGSTWLFACFRPSIIVVMALAYVVAPEVHPYREYGSPVLFPDLVGRAIDATVEECCFVGAMWSFVVWVALLGLSAAMWRLARQKG